MKIVHCPGHTFDKVRVMVDDKVLNVKYVCGICKLTVKTSDAAEYLEGKVS